jgi:hypothetical protein
MVIDNITALARSEHGKDVVWQPAAVRVVPLDRGRAPYVCRLLQVEAVQVIGTECRSAGVVVGTV